MHHLCGPVTCRTRAWQVVEDILDDDQDMEDMNLRKRAENDQILAVCQQGV